MLTDEQLDDFAIEAHQYRVLSDPRGRLAGIVTELLVAEVRSLRTALGECVWAYDNDSVKLEADDLMWDRAHAALGAAS